MYRQLLATKKLKEKSTLQPNSLAPVRSAVHRRPTRRQSRSVFCPELSDYVAIDSDGRLVSTTHTERSHNTSGITDEPSDSDTSSFVYDTSDDESLFTFAELTNMRHSIRESERSIQNAHNSDSLLGVDSRSLRRVPMVPNTSSAISRRLPAILQPSRSRGSPIVYTGIAPDQSQSRAPTLQRSHLSRGMVQEEVDGLGDRRRSPTPEDYSWETLRTTIAPDERLPSVHSSFTSTGALSTSDPTRSSLTATGTCVVCSALYDNSRSEESGPESV